MQHVGMAINREGTVPYLLFQQRSLRILVLITLFSPFSPLSTLVFNINVDNGLVASLEKH